MTEAFAPPAPNLPLIRKVLDHIEAHPETHDQDTWGQRTECGTTLCFAARALALAGGVFEWYESVDGGELIGQVALPGQPTAGGVERTAKELLGLDRVEVEELFFRAREVADVREVCEQIAHRAGEQL